MRTLDDVCLSIADGDHQAPPKSESGVPFITISCLNPDGGEIDYSGASCVPREYYESLPENRRAKPGDALLSVVGSLGIPYLVKEGDEFVFQRHIAVLRAGKDILPEYLYYLLKSPGLLHVIDSIAQGAAQRTLTLTQLRGLEVEVPPIEAQKRIIAKLQSYDTLIDNNRRQIKLLEEAAQRLYKEWFIDLRFPGCETTPIINGLPEGWEQISMADLGDYLNGYAFKPADHFDKGYPIIKIKELKNGVCPDTPCNPGKEIPEKYYIKRGDIVFSWSATLVADIWSDETGLLNQHLFKVSPKEGIASEYVVQTINYLIKEMTGLTTGSTMTHLQRNKLSVIKTVLPNIAIMERYAVIASKIQQAVLANKKSCFMLQEARDRLLPKLMSGEIEV